MSFQHNKFSKVILFCVKRFDMHKTPISGSKEKTTDICSVPVVYVPGSNQQANQSVAF